MAIKIIKKHHAGAVRTPAPLVESDHLDHQSLPDQEETTPKVNRHREGCAAPVAEGDFIPKTTVCEFCKHPYIYPCHGKSDTCMNAIWRRKRMARAEGQ